MSDKKLERARDMLYTLAPSHRDFERDAFVKHHEQWVAEQFREVEREAQNEAKSLVSLEHTTSEVALKLQARAEDKANRLQAMFDKITPILQTIETQAQVMARRNGDTRPAETILHELRKLKLSKVEDFLSLLAWDAATKGISHD